MKSRQLLGRRTHARVSPPSRRLPAQCAPVRGNERYTRVCAGTRSTTDDEPAAGCWLQVLLRRASISSAKPISFAARVQVLSRSCSSCASPMCAENYGSTKDVASADCRSRGKFVCPQGVSGHRNSNLLPALQKYFPGKKERGKPRGGSPAQPLKNVPQKLSVQV